jgi:hypothetical protein
METVVTQTKTAVNREKRENLRPLVDCMIVVAFVVVATIAAQILTNSWRIQFLSQS